MFEILLLLIFPYPGFEYYLTFHHRVTKTLQDVINHEVIEYKYFLSDFLFAIMFFRILFGIRAFYNYSIYMDAFSRRLCDENQVNSSTRFVMKC